MPNPTEDEKDQFIAEAKILRIFNLIGLLKQKTGHSIEDLALDLGRDKRTIYRYLKLLEEVGYDVDSRDGRYFITEAADTLERRFTEQEAQLLNQRLVDVGDANPLVASIRLKVKLTSEIVPLPNELRTMNQAEFIDRLQVAIQLGRRVRLVRYRTTNTAEVRDRVVEPVALTDKLTQLIAMEVEKGEKRTFNLSRMQDVDILDEPCTFPPGDREPDLFGMAATDRQPVELLLTERAYQLLIREYPEAVPHCLPAEAGRSKGDTASDGPRWAYRFRDKVRGYEGVGRFVMGLPTEVRVVAPDAFRTFVRKKSARAAW